MLRNVQRSNPQQHLRHIEWNSKVYACISTACGGVGTSYAKTNNITNFQSKVMSKLIGQRLSGSKKRRFVDSDTYTSKAGNKSNADFFSSKKLAIGTSGSGKNTTRRMAVLNKLFMEHITDLLATGEASEAILGRGLQVTRVKISPDFTGINVYWLGKGEPMADAALETELKRCSGVLRHELSQLMLMGEVPRITFAREKKFTHINEVEGILRTLDFGPTEEELAQAAEGSERTDDSQEERKKYNLVANMMQREFYGKNVINEVTENAEGNKDEEFPEMRHDVLGLDHQHIMSKLLLKMRKSQQAWAEHTQKVSCDANSKSADANHATIGGSESLEKVQKRIAEAAEKAERFQKFLANRRERKNTPERKHHDRASDWKDDAGQEALEAASYAALTPLQRRLLEEEDYVLEDSDKNEGKIK